MRVRVTLLTLPSAHDIALPILGELEGVPHNALARVDDGVGILLHDWETALDVSQPRVRELISLGHVWLGIAVWSLEVGLNGLAELLVGGVGEVKGLLAVWVGLEGLDAVGDDRVGVEMGEEFAGGRGAVGEGCGFRHGVVGGCVRHRVGMRSLKGEGGWCYGSEGAMSKVRLGARNKFSRQRLKSELFCYRSCVSCDCGLPELSRGARLPYIPECLGCGCCREGCQDSIEEDW